MNEQIINDKETSASDLNVDNIDSLKEQLTQANLKIKEKEKIITELKREIEYINDRLATREKINSLQKRIVDDSNHLMAKYQTENNELKEIIKFFESLLKIYSGFSGKRYEKLCEEYKINKDNKKNENIKVHL